VVLRSYEMRLHIEQVNDDITEGNETRGLPGRFESPLPLLSDSGRCLRLFQPIIRHAQL
jgi:hypothetical protein